MSFAQLPSFGLFAGTLLTAAVVLVPRSDKAAPLVVPVVETVFEGAPDVAESLRIYGPHLIAPPNSRGPVTAFIRAEAW